MTNPPSLAPSVETHERCKFFFFLHRCPHLMSPIASRSAKVQAMANPSTYKKRNPHSCFHCKQNGSVPHAEDESDPALCPHHLLHNLGRVQRNQSVSVSFMFVIMHATHLRKAAQKARSIAPKVQVQSGKKGIASCLVTCGLVAHVVLGFQATGTKLLNKPALGSYNETTRQPKRSPLNLFYHSY